MQPVDLANRLSSSLEASFTLLQRMAEGLRERRANWISSRASVIAEPAHSLADLAQKLEREESIQRELIAQAKPLFPARISAAGERSIHARDLCALLPTPAASRLRKAADRAAAAGKAVRRELALGERLLRFSKHAQEALVESAGLAAAQQRDDVGSYDRNARRLAAALPRTGTAPGTLVDGRI